LAIERTSEEYTLEGGKYFDFLQNLSQSINFIKLLNLFKLYYYIRENYKSLYCLVLESPQTAFDIATVFLEQSFS